MADTAGARRVLVVDDDAAMRRLLEVILSRAGFDVETAGSGAEAIGALLGTPSRQPCGVDVLLLDGVLPDMRGFELARRLLDHEATARLPICFLTGAVHGRVAPEAGIACVVKPATPTQVVSALEGIIADAAGADPAERRRAIDHVEELALL